MRFRELVLKDFRQFYGEQRLEFSTADEKNVTLIWGANGAGKTTLLNAFTWVLYAKFTPDFEQQDHLVNDQRWARLGLGEKAEVSVQLEFEHEDCIYHLSRKSVFRRRNDGIPEVLDNAVAELTMIDQEGRSHRRDNPNDVILRILPKDLHHFFFFNGERIEQLVQPTAYKEIGQAIKTTLGLEVVERSLRHLPQVSKKLEDELRKLGTDEHRQLSDEKTQLVSFENDLREQIEQAKRNIAALEVERTTKDEELRKYEGSKELQRQRDELNDEDRRIDGRIREIKRSIDEWIVNRGFLAFAGDLLDFTKKNFAERRTRGEIPTPIKKEFISDLLERGQCICGTLLAEGTAPHKAICDWKSKAGLIEVDEAWITLHAEAGSLLQRRGELSEELARLLSARVQAREEKQRCIERISEVSTKLQSVGDADIVALEESRMQTDSQLSRTNRDLGALEDRLKVNKERLDECQAKLIRAEVKSKEAGLAQRRVAAVQEAVSLLQEIYNIRTEDVRRDLDERIRSVYRQISYKPFVPSLDDEFQLRLVHSEDGRPVAKSTGENQILGLSFVGALASLAKERYQKAQQSAGVFAHSGAAGGVFPIVMDAAFGTLDESYRRDVARGLPELAPQVIVLVSKAQGKGPVETEMGPRVGKSFVIQYKTSKEDVEAEKLEVRGRSIPYIDRAENGNEMALLIEVEG